MPPRESKLRPALEMVPQNVLRTMIDERSISFKSRYSEKLIDRLLEEEWTTEDFENLKERLARIERERTPKSRYIARIDTITDGLDQSTDAERVRHALEADSATFDDDGELIDEGFEIADVQSESLSGVHWTESLNYSLTPTNEIKIEQTLYETGFKLDFGNAVVFIESTLPPKAKSLLSELQNSGIETAEIGHGSLSNDQANQMVQSFVDDIDQELCQRTPQSSLGDDYERELIEVDMVKMLLDDLDLKDVRIGGHTDIMTHPQVERIQTDHDSRIVRLEGQFDLDNKWFEFTAGHTDGMGQVSVRKQGPVEENPEFVDQAFDFLYEHFERYFIDV